MDKQPTLIHVTHWKAGSQWIHKILRTCFSEKIVSPTLGNVQFVKQRVEADKVYPTVYVTKEEFDTATLPQNWHRFIIIRDLRDTLVSAYYSIKFSHPPMGQIAEWRKTLTEVDLEQGLIFLIHHWLPDSAAIQESWLKTTERILKYEDLLEHDVEIFNELIINQAKMNIAPARLEAAVVSARFENVTGGRRLGQENISMHERKGIPGDWKDKFSIKVKDEFKREYGDLLVKSGYEADRSW